MKTSEEEMDFEKSVIAKQDEGSGHGWSWSGDPEWKPVQNIVSRSCCTLVGRQMALFLYTGANWRERKTSPAATRNTWAFFNYKIQRQNVHVFK